MQVLVRAMLIDALHPALEDAEIALNGVRGHVATDVFAAGVTDAFVSRDVLLGVGVEAAFVGVEGGLARDVLRHDAGHGRLGRAVNMERADTTATLDESNDRHLVRRTAALLALVGEADGAVSARGLNTTEVGFVRFHHASERGQITRTHRLANAVRQKPRGLVGAFQGAL